MREKEWLRPALKIFKFLKVFKLRYVEEQIYLSLSSNFLSILRDNFRHSFSLMMI